MQPETQTDTAIDQVSIPQNQDEVASPLSCEEDLTISSFTNNTQASNEVTQEQDIESLKEQKQDDAITPDEGDLEPDETPYEGDLEPDETSDEQDLESDEGKCVPTHSQNKPDTRPKFEEIPPERIKEDVKKMLIKGIRINELSGYLKALQKGLAYNEKQAKDALIRLEKTKSPVDFEAFRKCFPPAVQHRIMQETMSFSNHQYQVAQGLSERQKILYTQTKHRNFQKENERWLRSKERRQAVEMALNLGREKTDLKTLKTLVEGIEKAAVGRYLKKQATYENQLRQDEIGSVGVSGNMSSSDKPKWLTREDFNRLTPHEYDKYYDRIVYQIELEKQGKLPRRLT